MMVAKSSFEAVYFVLALTGKSFPLEVARSLSVVASDSNTETSGHGLSSNTLTASTFIDAASPSCCLWLDKPFTLLNFTLTHSLFKYISPDSMYSNINSGGRGQIREKFDSFRKSHDPTPGIAFNRLEAEYHEREDYTFEHYRSFATRKGAATNRGKTYVLFDKPESVRREFRSDWASEIWNCPNLQRSLVFKEENFGEFKLCQTETI